MENINLEQTEDSAYVNGGGPMVKIARRKRLIKNRPKAVKNVKTHKLAKIIEKFLLILLFASAVTLAWAFYKNRAISNQAEIQNQTPLPRKKEILDLVKRIERHILLPEGETPSIATIVNIDSLKINPFYANAKNGDKVLIYFQAKKAYIYNPEMDLIINMAPVLTENSAASSTNTNSSPAIKK